MFHKRCLKLLSRASALIFASLLGLSVTPAFAADLQVDENGILTGAKNVNVGGKLYDVVFSDEKLRLALEFQGYPTRYLFNSFEAAKASQALFDFVFVDGPLGAFDSRPELTKGCSSNITICEIATPYDSVPYAFNKLDGTDLQPDVTQLYYSAASNANLQLSNDSVISRSRYFSWSNNINFTFTSIYEIDPSLSRSLALWSVAESISPVPEPEAYSMLLMGFCLLGCIFGRRKSQSN